MNDTKKCVGVVALSLPSVQSRRKRVKAAIAFLRKKGHKVVLGKTVFQQDGYRSASPQKRAQDLMLMFQDPRVDIVLNTTGGYNTNEILEFLNFDILKKNSKWFVGYSDCTVLNLALVKKCGMPSINGAMLVDFTDDNGALSCLLDVVEKKKTQFSLPSHLYEWDRKFKRPFTGLSILKGKELECTGSIIAGNLSTFLLLLGTPYLPSLQKKILFLEYDKEEGAALPSIERMLWQLRQSGAFEKISGLVFGALQKSVTAETTSRWSLVNILKEVTSGYTFPVIYNAPFGHVYPSWNLINGQKVRIQGTSITALEPVPSPKQKE